MNLEGEVEEDASFGVQTEGEAVNGQVKEGMSVKTLIDLDRASALPFDCWRGV